MNWGQYFPLPELRSAQEETLDFIAEHFAGTNDIFVEAPTGIGKSAVAIAAARWRASRGQSTYISTTTIALENQYMADFARLGLRQFHSKSRYPCPDCQTCDLGSRTAKAGSGNMKRCTAEPCTYQFAKNRFMAANLSITNAAFLLANARFVRGWAPRELGIFDEAHLLHETIAGAYCIPIFARDVRYLPAEGDELSWLVEFYVGWLSDQIKELEEEFQCASNDPDDPELPRIIKRLEGAERKAQNLRTLLADNPNEWVFDLQSDRLNIMPIWATKIAKELLPRIGKKRLYMSATLPGFEQQARYLGIDPKSAAFLSLDSPFPVKNRLIHVYPVVQWNRHDTRPAIAQVCVILDRILALHPNDRGLVHVSSYSQAQEIVDHCRNRRLITHGNAREKEARMERLFAEAGTVLVSPSSHEGLDLYGERSRFQVVAKLPFASLGDKRVKRRTETDSDWYSLNTAQKLVQACGRSIRSDSDYATTYLLDRAFERFYDGAHQFFPPYFQDSLRIDEVDLTAAPLRL